MVTLVLVKKIISIHIFAFYRILIIAVIANIHRRQIYGRNALNASEIFHVTSALPKCRD